MVCLLVSKLHCCFFDGSVIVSQKFTGHQSSLLNHPRLGRRAHISAKIPLKRARRDAAASGQPRYRPVGLFRQFQPVLNMVQFCIHASSSFNPISILQCGHLIFRPKAWAGNSMCSLQKKQDILSVSSAFRSVTEALQWGH